jgi:ATP-dependent Lhr-like helicase
LPPAEHAAAVWEPDLAIVEILRGRLEGLGPTTASALAGSLGLEPAAVAAGLLALEAEGTILRGRFIPGTNEEQWCDRRLLARIHHYTIRRLRSEIEPVAPRDFLRFLFAWQHLAEDARLEGPDALPAALAGLEGFEAPARAWETEILPARIADYQPSWLDAQCLAGRTAWARLSPGGGMERARPASPIGSAPIALIDRRRGPLWMALAPTADAARVSPKARAALERLTAQGALFFDELADAARLLRQQAEEALAELVAQGLATSDSFGGLRALLVPSSQRRPITGAKRRGRVLPFNIESGGRWSLVRRPSPDQIDETMRSAAVEHAAQALLRRYGVVFFRMLGREGGWLPAWRDLVRVYRRLEARGEIRGGRFVAGFSGEQYALPEAVGLLRETRRRPHSDQWVSLSAADPLNLLGVLTPGPRLAALTGNRVVFRDGLPVATLAGGKVEFLDEIEAAARWEAEKRLLRSAARGVLVDLA